MKFVDKDKRLDTVQDALLAFTTYNLILWIVSIVLFIFFVGSDWAPILVFFFALTTFLSFFATLISFGIANR
jgi:hypothetical protein